MHIAIDLTSLAGNYSGIEQYAFHLTRELVRGNPGDSFTLLFKGEIFPALQQESELPWVHPLVIHPSRDNKLLLTQVSVPTALRKVKADAYLFPAFPQPLTFWSNRSVTVIHDVSFWDCPETLTTTSRLYWRTSARHAARQRLVLTVSEFSRKRICERLRTQKDRVVVAYNGVDQRFADANQQRSEEFYSSIRSKYQLPSRFVLSLCTLEPRKNLSQLINAWCIARSQQEETPDLVLAGRKGWKVDGLLSTVPEHLLDAIHLTGFIDNEDLPHLYHLCDRFVCPSIYEGFGLPPLEALAAGAKVLCSDIEVFHETCGQYVTFFPLGDSDALAHLLYQPLPHVDGTDVCDRFSWAKSAQVVRNALNRLKA